MSLHSYWKADPPFRVRNSSGHEERRRQPTAFLPRWHPKTETGPPMTNRSTRESRIPTRLNFPLFGSHDRPRDAIGRLHACACICRCRAAGSSTRVSAAECRVSRRLRKVRLFAHGSPREMLRSSAVHDLPATKFLRAAAETLPVRALASFRQLRKCRFHSG